MNRYYINRVSGTGSPSNPYDPYTSELRVYLRTNWPNEPHFTKQAICAPWLMWSIMKYDLSQAAHDDVMANLTGIFSFLEGRLDKTVAEILPARRSVIKSKLNSIGFDFEWATSTTTVRQILKFMIRTMQMAEWAEIPITTVKSFDYSTTIGNMPQLAWDKLAIHLNDLDIPLNGMTENTTIADIVDKVQYIDGVTERHFGKRIKKQWLFQDKEDY
jgi:hypothetical protein